MHDKAHGGIPHSIIEVDPNVVESFLGRIEDPVKKDNETLNVIEDPAFRVLLVVEIYPSQLVTNHLDRQRLELKNFNRFLQKKVNDHNGRLVSNGLYSCLCSFRSIGEAKDCSLILKSEFRSISEAGQLMQLKIGLSSGVPISKGDAIFEETIKLAGRLCRVVEGDIVVSSDIRELYESEHLNISMDNGEVRFVNSADERFLNALMDYMDNSWNRANLKIHDFCAKLGLSKSQLYRKVKSITGKSLNIFVREYRMRNALKMMERHEGNISEIAFDTGFNSPAYFSKCFYDTYGILPSNYVKEV
jgi:AraC-like DNA-binding protein